MSFFSTLANIGGLVAAPFTGGASLAIGPAIGAASSVLGKQRQGAAAGREAEGNINQQQDRNAINLYGTRQQAQNAAAVTDLARKDYSDKARGTNASRAVIAGILGGGKMGSHISVPGVTNAQVSGGPLAALADNPDALAALAELGKQSSENLTNPAPFTGGEMIQAPSLTPLPKESKGGGFLDAIANIGQIVGAVSPFIKRRGGDSDMGIGDYGG